MTKLLMGLVLTLAFAGQVHARVSETAVNKKFEALVSKAPEITTAKIEEIRNAINKKDTKAIEAFMKIAAPAMPAIAKSLGTDHAEAVLLVRNFPEVIMTTARTEATIAESKTTQAQAQANIDKYLADKKSKETLSDEDLAYLTKATLKEAARKIDVMDPLSSNNLALVKMFELGPKMKSLGPKATLLFAKLNQNLKTSSLKDAFENAVKDVMGKDTDVAAFLKKLIDCKA